MASKRFSIKTPYRNIIHVILEELKKPIEEESDWVLIEPENEKNKISREETSECTEHTSVSVEQFGKR
jgi:hypothetical protein